VDEAADGADRQSAVFQARRRGAAHPWLICTAVALSVVVAAEIRKTVRRRTAAAGGWLAPLVTIAILTPFAWWTMHFLLAGRVPWLRLLPSAIFTGVFFGGLGRLLEVLLLARSSLTVRRTERSARSSAS